MIDVPGTEYIHYHKDKGFYQITKRVGKHIKSFGYGKTLIIALMKRDYVIANNWKPYPKNSKTGEKHIRLVDNHYKVMKRIKGKYRTYGSFTTLEEAIQYRDFIVKKGWSTNYKYKNPMRNINKTSSGNYRITKCIKGDKNSYGTFESLEECKRERDLLEKYDFDFNKLVEHFEGEEIYLNRRM